MGRQVKVRCHMPEVMRQRASSNTYVDRLWRGDEGRSCGMLLTLRKDVVSVCKCLLYSCSDKKKRSWDCSALGFMVCFVLRVQFYSLGDRREAVLVVAVCHLDDQTQM